MSRARPADLAEGKALLAARAELDRARLALAVYEIKGIVAPTRDDDRVARARPLASMLVGIVGAAAGRPRLARWLRIASIALAALRIARYWR